MTGRVKALPLFAKEMTVESCVAKECVQCTNTALSKEHLGALPRIIDWRNVCNN